MRKKRLFFFAFMFLLGSNIIAQIKHVEPLNWWVGMKNQQLQLIVNGTNIGVTQPAINYPGVTIIKTSRADSKHYLFIDLQIASNTKPGTFEIKFNAGGKTIETYNYTLLARQQPAASFVGFNSTDAVYLIMPDRFANGDYSNDVVPTMKEKILDRSNEGGRHGGDIRGIINHLDYIKDMGFTAIWSTPLLENDMEAYSYHGYSITNHYKVDPRYGTLDDYKELAAKAKEKGIKLIFDEVLNHTGSNYWWMNDLPFKNWLNYPDVYTPSNHRRTTNQDMYASAYDKDLMTNGWFDKTMPDMNGKNPFLANYLLQSTIWWIETLKLGGIRQDTYGYSDKSFLKMWSCRIMEEYPNFSMVGEEWSFNPLIESYWQKGKQNHDGYISCLSSVMDFPLQGALVQALKEPEGSDFGKGMTKLYEALANDFAYANPKQILVFGDNHDMDRMFTQLDGDVALTKMAIAYLLTTRGIPQLFYGTEILAENKAHPNNHGYIRTDFPGGWKEDVVDAFAEKGLSADQQAMQLYVKKLLNWRKKNAVIAEGNILHFAPYDGTYTFFRYNKEKTIMVVMNKNEKAKNIDTKRFAEILKKKATAVNIMTGEKFLIGSSFSVPEKTAIVLEIN